VGTVLGRTVQGDVMHKLSAALLDPERGAELMKNHKLGKAASFNTDLMDSVKGSLISEIFRRASGG
jgi:hypothetical protein